ncbi:MAG: biosynthetic-type acetolactate synthase large subunit [Desulfovibrio sp.]|jgi:acetolactate synthase-1/2/3 large subunit|nr:biosynthetic-type acetolactate synthase large subunit [Desulfovibrio sp.]
MELTGAQILVECLGREGIDTIFGYPGGAVIDIYDELSRHQNTLRHILVRHEQAAVHAADGYSRVSGKVGVCLVTSGPGATNAVTGIATAYSDSIPMVILTGQVPTGMIGNDAFQEVDIIGITRPCTKHSYLIKNIKEMAGIIRQAFYLARTGRPGPVLVDLPKDIVISKTDFIWPEEVRMRSYNPTYKPNLVQLRRAADLILKARQPLILAGGGVVASNTADLLSDLAMRYKIPVVSTLMGLGSFPGTHPLWCGMVGMHGSVVANRVVNEADVLVAVGTRFSDRVTGKISAFASRSSIIHIDVDPTSIRKNVNVAVPVVSDCRQAIIGLSDVLAARADEKDWEKAHDEWLSSIVHHKEAHPITYVKNGEIKPQQVIECLYELTKNKYPVITTEVGQHQMWATQFFKYTKSRTFLSSGGLGTMGYGLPAAMGAQVALPGRLVIGIAGDASIQMNIQELATIVQNKLPVKIVILNNRYLGMVRQWQELFYKQNYMSTCMDGQPDFVKLADAYGAEGYLIDDASKLADMLQTALDSPNPALIDVKVAREENVYPMVPAGAALDEMLLV